MLHKLRTGYRCGIHVSTPVEGEKLLMAFLMHFLYFAPFFPFIVSGARLRVADIARSHSQATVPPVPPRAMVKLWNPNHLVARWCGRGRERLVPLTYSTPLIDR